MVVILFVGWLVRDVLVDSWWISWDLGLMCFRLLVGWCNTVLVAWLVCWVYELGWLVFAGDLLGRDYWFYGVAPWFVVFGRVGLARLWIGCARALGGCYNTACLVLNLGLAAVGWCLLCL